MTVTVLGILETDFIPEKNLARVMKDRLQRAAMELQDSHFKALSGRGFFGDDLIVYLSYSPKSKIRYRIVNDVRTISSILLLKPVAGSATSFGAQYLWTFLLRIFNCLLADYLNQV